MKRLSKAQREVLERMAKGEYFEEYIIPDLGQQFFRTLGKLCAGELVHEIGSDLVRYETFRILFKRNLITDSEPRLWRKSSHRYILTPAGRAALEENVR